MHPCDTKVCRPTMTTLSLGGKPPQFPRGTFSPCKKGTLKQGGNPFFNMPICRLVPPPRCSGAALLWWESKRSPRLQERPPGLRPAAASHLKAQTCKLRFARIDSLRQAGVLVSIPLNSNEKGGVPPPKKLRPLQGCVKPVKRQACVESSLVGGSKRDD